MFTAHGIKRRHFLNRTSVSWWQNFFKGGASKSFSTTHSSLLPRHQSIHHWTNFEICRDSFKNNKYKTRVCWIIASIPYIWRSTDSVLVTTDNQIFMLFLSFAPRWKIFGGYYKAVRTHEFYILVKSVHLCSVIPNSTPPRLVKSQMFSSQPVGILIYMFSVIFTRFVSLLTVSSAGHSSAKYLDT